MSDKENNNYLKMTFLKAAQYGSAGALFSATIVGGLCLWAGPELANGIAVTIFSSVAGGTLGGLLGAFNGARQASNILKSNMRQVRPNITPD